jgi:hypothetical protein
MNQDELDKTAMEINKENDQYKKDLKEAAIKIFCASITNPECFSFGLEVLRDKSIEQGKLILAEIEKESKS